MATYCTGKRRHATRTTGLSPTPLTKSGTSSASSANDTYARKDTPMFNFKWWKRGNKRDKEWERFRNWYQMHKQAEQFTSVRCHFCRTPAHSPEANYCSHCGARFHTEPALHT